VRNTDHDTFAEPVNTGGGSTFNKLRLAHSSDSTCVGTDVLRQTTISTSITMNGIGLHKGTLVRLVLKPADANTGIVFRRTDLETSDRAITDIPARYDSVIDATMCTTIGNAAGTKVATIEHLMAAVSALQIDNLLIEVDAEEVPVMDGSSDAFIALLDQAGQATLASPRRYIRVLEPIALEDGLRHGTLHPCDDGLRIELSIDFDNQVIGKQDLALTISPDSFRRELARSRTFGFLKDVEMLRSLGLAKGATLENAVVLDGEEVLNDGGLRSPDEFVRHKTLDAVGDLALAGAPILGCYNASRAGHAFNNQVLHALFANPDSWEYVTCDESVDVMADVPKMMVSAD
jgi:UDP-3-O-[3-hydroxymyristoyl] N-acetylglucosamine deacetylase|tara:strand:- start:1092 stop:2132 length:1041 start_codon:yes stop_codon:yes gene_type:complete